VLNIPARYTFGGSLLEAMTVDAEEYLTSGRGN
jgi:hypothetical protein